MTSIKELTAISKFLSLVLRHQPDMIRLTLDPAGWARVDELLAKAAASGRKISRDTLHHVVETSDKKRFSLSEDGTRIRANQGHSVHVELGLAPAQPPDVLYHGTATRSLASVLGSGLDKRKRHHVHLSTEVGTAVAVGKRYGAPVLLVIDARKMHADGHVFFRSDNGVWLTDHVPPSYIAVQA
jgi:putative RNA 2'-phosphotransferase